MNNIKLELEELIKKDAENSTSKCFYESVTLVACGQAGAAITQDIKRKFANNGLNIHAVIINTSKEDIRSLLPATNKLEVIDTSDIYRFPDGEGAAQQGKTTMDLIQKNKSEFDTFIGRRIKGETVIIVTSTCGGSGSALSTYVAGQLLKKGTGKTISMVAVTPASFEGVLMESNNYKFFSRCQTVKGLGSLMVFDNNQGTISAINESIAEKLFHLLRVTDTNDRNYNVDTAELKAALATGGIMLVGVTESADIMSLRESLEYKTYHLDADAAYRHIIFSARNDSEFVLLEEVASHYGGYVAVYKGVNPDKIVCCMAGFKLPLDRLNAKAEQIKESIEKMNSQFNTPKKSLNYTFDIDLTSNQDQDDSQDDDDEDIFSLSLY